MGEPINSNPAQMSLRFNLPAVWKPAAYVIDSNNNVQCLRQETNCQGQHLWNNEALNGVHC